jgi:F-type H+-transporting ATPase subunit gamma
MEGVERAQVRLDNIRTVEPILGALRTISLGSWRAALKRRDEVRHYEERLRAMVPALLPHVRPSPRWRLLAGWRARRKTPPSPAHIAALVIGSERGLCGGFNATVVGRAEQYLAELSSDGAKVELMALGTQVSRIFRQRQRPLAWSGALPVTALPPHRLAFGLTRQWLACYEERDLEAVDLIYNAYRGTARYEPAVARLIPPTLDGRRSLRSILSSSTSLTVNSVEGPTEPWPPPIIETDPLSLYGRVVEQWIAASLYGILLESAAAEHSARFQLLEGSTQNAERLTAELALVVQATRQQAITREMQDLVAGAGLVGTRPD